MDIQTIKTSQLPTIIDLDAADEMHVNHGGASGKITLQALMEVFGVPDHLADADLHRVIDDAGDALTDLWSAAKIIEELALKAAASHNHAASDINSGALSVVRGGTGLSAININNLLYASANNVLAELSLNSSLSINSGVLGVNFPATTFQPLYQATTRPHTLSGQTFVVNTTACRDSTNVADIYKATTTNVNLGASGINGLVTDESPANNTFYYLYAISKTGGADPGLILSPKNVAGGATLTGLPTDYVLFRQLWPVFKTDGSANFHPAEYLPGQRVRWDLTHTYFNGSGYTAGTTNVFDNTIASAGSWGSVSLAAWMPPTSRHARLRIGLTNLGGTYVSLNFRQSSSNAKIRSCSATATAEGYSVQVQTSSSQAIEIERRGGTNTQSFKIDVEEFVVTEVH